MNLDIVKQVTWFDILVVILLIRICYISVKTGFTSEIFKILGVILATYLVCHYYNKFGIFLNTFLAFKGASAVNLVNLAACLALAAAGYFIFVIIRLIFGILFRMEAASLLNHWGALMLSAARWALSVSLIVFIINITHLGYLNRSQSSSYLGPRLLGLSPRVYAFLWNNIMSRFADKDEFNKSVFRDSV